jgi:hypothetical protein
VGFKVKVVVIIIVVVKRSICVGAYHTVPAVVHYFAGTAAASFIASPATTAAIAMLSH